MATYASKMRDADTSTVAEFGGINPIGFTKSGSSTIAAAGAIPLTKSVCVATIAGTYAWTLANGTPGQVLVVTLGTATSGAGTITPTTATGWATAVFSVAGDGLSLLYVDDTVGWIVTGSYGTTSSTAATVITI